jgi:putative ABC transport system permease protein
LLFFALKNITRNKRRSTTMLGMITLGSLALLLAGGYSAATFRLLRENTIANGLGHIQIGGPGFREEEPKPLASGLTDVASIRRIARGNPHVRAAAARIEFGGLASNGEKSVVFLGRGIEPDEEYHAAGFGLAMRSGQPLSSKGKSEAMLGIGLAKSLRVGVGDRITLLAQTVDGAINGADVQVVGTYTTGVKEFDDRALMVRLDTAQLILNTTKVSKLIVVLDNTSETEPVKAALQVALSHGSEPTEMATWSDLATFYHQVRGLYSGIFIFLGVIIVGLVILSSGNAMTMAVMERVKEIGTLMALGTSRSLVLVMFITEAFGLGLLGGAIGALLGWLAAYGLNAARIILPPPPTFSRGVPLIIDTVPALWMAVPVLMLITLLIASFLPAARAARLRITDALGHAGLFFFIAILGLGATLVPTPATAQPLEKQPAQSQPAQTRLAQTQPAQTQPAQTQPAQPVQTPPQARASGGRTTADGRAATDARAGEILKQADEFRNPGAWPSLRVRTRIDNFESDKLSETADYDVAIKGDNSLVTFLSPKTKGQSLLMRGDDMWLYLPSVARGVRITPIQRLLGNASNGDLARLRYSIDYAPTMGGEETVNGLPCIVLELQAARKAATYQRIKYAVRKSDSMPVKADFFLASGRHIKTAFFDEPKVFDGHQAITRIIIYDDLKTASKTVMTFQDFQPQRIDDKIFNPSHNEGS